MNLKIVYVLNSFPNISETFILDEIVALIELGVAVEVVSLDSSSDSAIHENAQKLLDEGLVHYYFSPSKLEKLAWLIHYLVRHPSRLWRLFKLNMPKWLILESIVYTGRLNKIKLNKLHCHYAAKSAQVALVANVLEGSPFAVTTHGYDVFFDPPSNYDELTNAAEQIFTISNFNRVFLLKQYCLPEDKIKVNYCGVTIENFNGGAREYFAKRPSITILTVARLHPVKGHSLLLNAVAKLKLLKDIKFELLFAGDGPLKDELKSEVLSLGLVDEVEFLGNQTQSQIVELIGKSDLFVLPSLSEGLPISLMEAMAGWLPVVGPKVNGVPELIENRVNGRLFEPGCVDSLVAILGEVLESPEVLDSYATNARKTIEEKFSLAANVRNKFLS